MLPSWLMSSSILRGSLVAPLLTRSTVFLRVLHCAISRSTALSITAILGSARTSFLADSSISAALSAFMVHPRASPLRTRSDAVHTSESASRRDASGP